MKQVRPKRALTVLALSGVIATALVLIAVPNAGAIQEKYRISPGESIGPVDLGMRRKKVEGLALLHGKPNRAHDSTFYSLTYHYPEADSGLLIITFHGLTRRAKAISVLTVDRNLATNRGVGVGDKWLKMAASYPGVDCYHRIPGGGRDDNVDDNENEECELHSNGGYTYFSFASIDADPGHRIGAIAVTSVRVD